MNKPKKAKFAVPLMVVFVLLCGKLPQSNLAFSQTTHEPIEHITNFEAQDETLRQVLETLSEKYDLNFTYNAEDPSFNTKVNLNIRQKTTTDILEEILEQTGHDHKTVGNHLVIFHLPENQNKTTPPTKKHQVPDAESPANISNTDSQNPTMIADQNIAIIEREKSFTSETPIRDTVFITDTIVKTETQILRDTIVIERFTVRSGNVPRPVRLMREVLSIDLNQTERWAFSIHYTHMLFYRQISNPGLPDNDFQRIADSEGLSFRNFGLGAEMRFNTGNLTLTSGISFHSFSNRFSYQEIITRGGFNKIDTLDVFYTLLQNDTIWKYITDTTYIPLESEETFYDRMNHKGFLELNVGGIYNILNTNQYSLFIKGGVHAGIPVWLSGNTINNAGELPATPLEKENVNNMLWAYRAGTGIRFKLSEWNDIYAETYYKRYINDVITNYPVEQRINGLGLQIGIIYYL